MLKRVVFTNHMSFGLARCISTTRRPNYAFAFDIDGVLIKVKLKIKINLTVVDFMHRERTVFPKPLGK